MQQSKRLNKISLKSKEEGEIEDEETAGGGMRKEDPLPLPLLRQNELVRGQRSDFAAAEMNSDGEGTAEAEEAETCFVSFPLCLFPF
ncbi:hypothetical protein LINGRAHAP2_LOCUS35007 [Linum grandiflorum]